MPSLNLSCATAGPIVSIDTAAIAARHSVLLTVVSLWPLLVVVGRSLAWAEHVVELGSLGRGDELLDALGHVRDSGGLRRGDRARRHALGGVFGGVLHWRRGAGGDLVEDVEGIAGVALEEVEDRVEELGVDVRT